MRLSLVLWLTILFQLPGLMGSAQHYYYIPNTTQIPAAKQRDDASVDIRWSRNIGATAVEVQGMYSLRKNVLVLANYMNAGEKAVLNNTQEGLKYRFYEVGAGLYEALPRGTASLLAGFGHGDIYNYFQGEEYADLDIQRWFVQPGILYNDDLFQGGICLRFSGVRYTKGYVGVAIPENDLRAIETIEQKSPFFLPEVGITGGLKLLPFVALGVSLTGIFPRTENTDFVRVNSSFFVRIELGKMIRKGKKEPKEQN